MGGEGECTLGRGARCFMDDAHGKDRKKQTKSREIETGFCLKKKNYINVCFIALGTSRKCTCLKLKLVLSTRCPSLTPSKSWTAKCSPRP